MRRARCTLDDMNYSSQDFSEQDDAWRLERKGTLECIECDGPAYYRGKTPKGHAACFAARHTLGCTQASRVSETQEGEGVAVVPAIENEGRVLQLRLDGPVPRPAGSSRRAVDETPNPDGVRRYVPGTDNGERRRANHASMGLRVLLSNLVNDPLYTQSNERMRVPDRGDVPLRDLIRGSHEVSAADLDRTTIVWGKVVSVGGEPGGTRYLNTGPYMNNPCPVTLSSERAGELLEILGWDNLRNLWGGHVIVFGKIRLFRGRHYIEPEDINKIALLTP